jgi:hypothetical protein
VRIISARWATQRRASPFTWSTWRSGHEKHP